MIAGVEDTRSGKAKGPAFVLMVPSRQALCSRMGGKVEGDPQRNRGPSGE